MFLRIKVVITLQIKLLSWIILINQKPELCTPDVSQCTWFPVWCDSFPATADA